MSAIIHENCVEYRGYIATPTLDHGQLDTQNSLPPCPVILDTLEKPAGPLYKVGMDFVAYIGPLLPVESLCG